MTDRPLLLHWNELSVPVELSATELNTDPRWRHLAETAFQAFQDVLRVRPDCRISFTKGSFHGHIADRPLQSWLEIWLGKDKLRKLRGRAVQPMTPILPPIHSLECELSCNGLRGEGITRAHIADTWAWSMGSAETGSAEDSIQAVKTSIDAEGNANVNVTNLASRQHFDRWQDDLQVWGKSVSNNHVIAFLDRYLVIMYPLDHGYPHIHVQIRDDDRLNAKYRVDVSEPLTKQRPAGLDLLIEPWIAQRREQLLLSWDRCQAGGFPLKLK